MTQETKIEPRSKALAYELAGVLADVDAGGEFDDVCYSTVERVMQELLGSNVDTFTTPEIEHMAEEAECVHKCLDDARVPRGCEADSSGHRLMYSLWGRVSLYGERKEMPDDVKKLVDKLRQGQDFDYFCNLISPDGVMEEAADALEAAYGVSSKDKQC